MIGMGTGSPAPSGRLVCEGVEVRTYGFLMVYVKRISTGDVHEARETIPGLQATGPSATHGIPLRGRPEEQLRGF